MVRSRIRITAHELVGHEIGPSRLTPKVIETALAQVRRRGYVPSFVPPPDAHSQHLILVLATHPFAALYRALAPDGSATPVQRGLIESRTKVPVTELPAGLMLARYGLAIMRVSGCCVVLQGTSCEMAHMANVSRYMALAPRPSWMTVESATGIVLPPSEIDDDLRLRTALVYHEHGIEAEGLLDGEDKCTPVSHWRFPESETQPDDLTPPF